MNQCHEHCHPIALREKTLGLVFLCVFPWKKCGVGSCGKWDHWKWNWSVIVFVLCCLTHCSISAGESIKGKCVENFSQCIQAWTSFAWLVQWPISDNILLLVHSGFGEWMGCLDQIFLWGSLWTSFPELKICGSMEMDFCIISFCISGFFETKPKKKTIIGISPNHNFYRNVSFWCDCTKTTIKPSNQVPLQLPKGTPFHLQRETLACDPCKCDRWSMQHWETFFASTQHGDDERNERKGEKKYTRLWFSLWWEWEKHGEKLGKFL